MSGGEWWVGVVPLVRARYSCRGKVSGGSSSWVLVSAAAGWGFSLFSRSPRIPRRSVSLEGILGEMADNGWMVFISRCFGLF